MTDNGGAGMNTAAGRQGHVLHQSRTDQLAWLGLVRFQRRIQLNGQDGASAGIASCANKTADNASKPIKAAFVLMEPTYAATALPGLPLTFSYLDPPNVYPIEAP